MRRLIAFVWPFGAFMGGSDAIGVDCRPWDRPSQPAIERLGSLADPALHHGAIDVSGELVDELIADYRMMNLIRRAEELIGEASTRREVKCPVHLGIGQEAIAVGVSRALRKSDRVFGAHRSHAHFLALGAPVYKLFAEVLGKFDGASKGMGGSMHLIDLEHGFYGSVPIVGATIPIAVGAALAAKLDRPEDMDMGVVYFGDGACEEGVLHESLNLAATMGLPAFFVAENNLFSSHLHISLRQPSDRLARFAVAHGVVHEVVDGNDVVAVSNAAKRLTRICRGGTPVFLEAVTYRWRGHVGPREDVDVGVQRREDLKDWRKRDPIARLALGMTKASVCDAARLDDVMAAIEMELKAAWHLATQSDSPPASFMMEAVFAGRSEFCREL